MRIRLFVVVAGVLLLSGIGFAGVQSVKADGAICGNIYLDKTDAVIDLNDYLANGDGTGFVAERDVQPLSVYALKMPAFFNDKKIKKVKMNLGGLEIKLAITKFDNWGSSTLRVTAPDTTSASFEVKIAGQGWTSCSVEPKQPEVNFIRQCNMLTYAKIEANKVFQELWVPGEFTYAHRTMDLNGHFYDRTAIYYGTNSSSTKVNKFQPKVSLPAWTDNTRMVKFDAANSNFMTVTTCPMWMVKFDGTEPLPNGNEMYQVIQLNVRDTAGSNVTVSQSLISLP